MLGMTNINFKQSEIMTEITITKKGNTAKIWVQPDLIGGMITDENGNDTVVSKMCNDLKDYFQRVEEKTGIKFFKQ